MPADLFIYALVAAGLVFWLRSILGTRHGDEQQRSNPYTAQAETPRDQGANRSLISVEEPIAPEQRIIDLAQNPVAGMAVENKAAEQGLIEIAKQDRGFDIKHFLTGAQDAFVIIVEAFAEGDRHTLEGLLTNDVYKAFESAITAREQRGEKQQAEIHAIRKSEVIAACIRDKTALITIRFTAGETTVTRDESGEILSGHPDKVTEMRDIWVFGRALKSRDPRWLVHETRSDLDGDNDLIPNTDS